MQRARLALAGLLVAVAIWEIVWTRHAESSVPGDAAWHRAAAAVRSGYQPGDLIVFAPAWEDPVGRLHLGDLIPVEMAARMDAGRYSRIWEVSTRGAHAPDVAGLSPLVTQEIDGVTVRFFQKLASPVLADVLDRAPAGSVQLQEIGFAPHRCVMIVPSPNVPAKVTIPGLPAGHLVGYVGLADVFKRRDVRSPALLDVEVGGVAVTTVTAGIDDGWVRFEATLPTAGDVSFVAHATDRDRLVCFAAEVRP